MTLCDTIMFCDNNIINIIDIQRQGSCIVTLFMSCDSVHILLLFMTCDNVHVL